MKIAIVGYGVMGRAVERLAPEFEADIAARIGSDDPPLDEGALRGATVAIEFAGPSGAPDRIIELARLGIPVVSGSTGWEDRYDAVVPEVREAGGALLHAPNLSLGVALFARVVREAAMMLDRLPEYRMELEETHHTRKVDHPSGTARWLADQIVERVSRLEGWEEVPAEGEAPDGVLPVHAYREGEVPGTHVVRAIGPSDRIELRHEAFDRGGFARGALEVASWIRDRRGVFTLEDFLGDRLLRGRDHRDMAPREGDDGTAARTNDHSTDQGRTR